MNYSLVFQPSFDFRFPLFGLALAVVGSLIAAYRRDVGYGLVGAGLIWALVTAAFLGKEYYVLNHAARDPATPAVIGTVEEFVAEPMDGHSEESFRVGDQRFVYSSFNHTGGFHQGRARGGPIHQGLPVRIGYLPTESGNLIVKLEIALK